MPLVQKETLEKMNNSPPRKRKRVYASEIKGYRGYNAVRGTDDEKMQSANSSARKSETDMLSPSIGIVSTIGASPYDDGQRKRRAGTESKNVDESPASDISVRKRSAKNTKEKGQLVLRTIEATKKTKRKRMKKEVQKGDGAVPGLSFREARSEILDAIIRERMMDEQLGATRRALGHTCRAAAESHAKETKIVLEKGKLQATRPTSKAKKREGDGDRVMGSVKDMGRDMTPGVDFRPTFGKGLFSKQFGSAEKQEEIANAVKVAKKPVEGTVADEKRKQGVKTGTAQEILTEIEDRRRISVSERDSLRKLVEAKLNKAQASRMKKNPKLSLAELYKREMRVSRNIERMEKISRIKKARGYNGMDSDEESIELTGSLSATGPNAILITEEMRKTAGSGATHVVKIKSHGIMDEFEDSDEWERL